MNIVPFHPYHTKLAHALERMGGYYAPSDITLAIAEGKMQSFIEGDSWAVTQIALFPRARVLEILLMVGNLPDCRILHDRIIEYAEENDITVIQAYGRRGWIHEVESRGWKVKARHFVYVKEL